MKKICLTICLALALFTMSLISVSAKANENYINKNGIEITKEQYDKLSKTFSEFEIDNMSSEQFEIELSSDFVFQGSNTIYTRTITTYDFAGLPIETISDTITEEEYNNSENEIMPLAGVEVSTDYKKLTISQLVSNTDRPYQKRIKITLSNTWKKTPATRSIDDIAIRWVAGYNNPTITLDTFSGIQRGDTSTTCLQQNYAQNGSNSKTFTNGVGISMDLYDAATSNMSNQLTLYVLSTLGSVDFYGSYQHTQKSVTLAQAMNYTLSSSGLGGVIKFNNATVQSYYDGMEGVWIRATA